MERVLYRVNEPISWVEKGDYSASRNLIIFPSERMLDSFIEIHERREGDGFFFSHDVFPFEEIGTSSRIRSERLALLRKLLLGELRTVYTSFHGILRKTVPIEVFEELSFKVEVGGPMTISEDQLQSLGYSRSFSVTIPGEFAIRGGIVDVFIPGSEMPVRIDTFDREIESIRSFDPVSQKSLQRLNEVLITPAAEGITASPFKETALKRIRAAEQATGVSDEILLARLDTMDTTAGIFYERQSILLDFLEGYSVIFVKPDDAIVEYGRRERETLELLSEKAVRKFLYIRYGGVSSEVLMKLNEYSIVSDGDVSSLDYDEELTEELQIIKRPRREEEYLPRIPVVDWTELEEGDYVVHKEYGIGRYLGVRTVENILGTREYLLLEYRDGNKIYVPVDRVDRVHKYIGSTEGIQLNSLRGTAWTRQKSKVNKEVKALISDLSNLYGSREVTSGIPLTGDSEMEKGFRDSFPYVETEDQQKAVQEVMEDLQSTKPMDRLISGDAGYGKTEVALRAAFRTVVSGKQVAVMVPTTVLARQHYENFERRLNPFGIRVEILDRYRTDVQRNKLLKKLKKGEVDVVVGTHSLLSKEVGFADLGLVVVDEEQLFGVLQKEHFKKLRLQVNVLSMSATPIPRTLYMSLSGLRDLSIISTPPAGRTSPEIYVGQINDRLIRTAVLRETNRGGQTIFVHNRVTELQELLSRLRDLLPEVKIDVAHGQMNKTAFERTIRDFYLGELDMLLCTTIIESGVDVPNANTLIVDDSHRYGLAQLYQLRGRVGRSNRRAFSYFLYDPKRLSGPSRERLKALKEFSGAGSGMKIAMRDLEIRGFGTLLGAEQHGNINSVGLYLYREMVEKAMRELHGEEEIGVEERTVDTELKNIPFDMVIPEEYVSDSIERLKIYRRIAACKIQDEIDEIELELLDRFGRLPAQVNSLLEASRVRLGAFNIGIKIVEYDPHSESIVMLHGENHIRDSLGIKGRRLVVNEREGKSILYGVPERHLMRTLKSLFLGAERNVQ
ncbi:transcription-repair coupling factor [Mesotoga prima]|uniref:transcription-repair coupling factor n=1 Tax=Mesotoga prima TaxID=1184387 RepID=UPI002D19D63E|nr:transcription-repair coupling factor [Mesotoga prima]HOP38064.1 transcription-repair coupling factor [Mesotoga prima]